MTSECQKCRGDEALRPCEGQGTDADCASCKPRPTWTCCSYAAQGVAHGVRLHVAGCPGMRPAAIGQAPKRGDRCAGVRIRDGRMVEAVWGVVTDASYLPGLRVHVTATRAFHSDTPLALAPADEWWDTEEPRWIGEWGGHAEEGALCWCVPTIERHGAVDIVVHREQEEAS